MSTWNVRIMNVFFSLAEMMDSSTFKRFTASIENILDNLEDMDFTAFGKINLKYIYPYSKCLTFCQLLQRIQRHAPCYQEMKSSCEVKSSLLPRN